MIPDLDPDHFVADGCALEPPIDLADLRRIESIGDLLGVEQRLDADLRDQGGATAGTVQIALLNVEADLVGQHRAKRYDGDQGQQPETKEGSQTGGSLSRGGEHFATAFPAVSRP
jgi:hypothetical protein